jgi:hypothetical protein
MRSRRRLNGIGRTLPGVQVKDVEVVENEMTNMVALRITWDEPRSAR